MDEECELIEIQPDRVIEIGGDDPGPVAQQVIMGPDDVIMGSELVIFGGPA